MKPPLKAQFCGFRFLGARCHCPRHHRIPTFHIRGRGKTMLLLLLGFTKGRGISSIYIHLCKSNHLESDFLNHEMDSVFFSRTSKTSSLVWEQTRDLKGWFWNERRKEGFAGLGQDLGTWEPRWSRDGGTRTVVRCTCSDWKEWGWSIGGDYWAAVFWFINWDCGRPIGPTVVDPANDKGHLRRKGL